MYEFDVRPADVAGIEVEVIDEVEQGDIPRRI